MPVPLPIPVPWPVPPINPVSETLVFLGMAGAQFAPPTTVSISRAGALSSAADDSGVSTAKGSGWTISSVGGVSSVGGGGISGAVSAAISWETNGSLGRLPLKMATLPNAKRNRR